MIVLKQRSLPGDILMEILSTLPRCISNSWLALIDDSKFAGLHLTRYKDNRDGEIDLIAQFKRCYSSDSQIEYGLLCGKTLTTTARLNSPTMGYKIVSVCDGLVILSNRIESEVMLWNPSIQKIRLIPKCYEMHFYEDFGLGFSSAINDYKYVTRKTGLNLFAVYTLGTNSWKMVEFQHERLSPDTHFIEFLFGGRSVCVKGVLYGISYDHDGGNYDVISFDLGSDTFGSLSFPDDYTNYRSHMPFLAVGDGGRSLSLVRFSNDGGFIWVRQTTTWAKCFRFDVNSPTTDIRMHLWFLHLWSLLINREMI